MITLCNHLTPQFTALGYEVRHYPKRSNTNAYSAWLQRQSSEHNLQIQQSFLGDHRVRRVHPLRIFCVSTRIAGFSRESK
jgi:hypothetical protein